MCQRVKFQAPDRHGIDDDDDADASFVPGSIQHLCDPIPYLRESSRGNTIRGNRTERLWEGTLPLRGSLRGPLKTSEKVWKPSKTLLKPLKALRELSETLSEADFPLRGSQLGERQSIEQKNVRAIDARNLWLENGSNAAKTSARATRLSTDERGHPFVWYFGAGWSVLLPLIVLPLNLSPTYARAAPESWGGDPPQKKNHPLSGPTATVILSRHTVALHSVALRFPGFGGVSQENRATPPHKGPVAPTGALLNSTWKYNSHETTTFKFSNSASRGPKVATVVTWQLLHLAIIERQW